MRGSLAFRGRLYVVAVAVTRGGHFLVLGRVSVRGEGERKGKRAQGLPAEPWTEGHFRQAGEVAEVP